MKRVYQIASSLVLLAMTEGGHCGRSPRVVVSPSSPVIASLSPPVILTLSEVKGRISRCSGQAPRGNPRKAKLKMQNDRAKMKKSQYEAES